ncbi:MAG: PRC-barrel domain-containing protein [Candidatus Thermoplasmatota archaeon]|nr:PRC-barrel domain-containing protein [Candidatus Thermoplasmatota archaeon]
MLANVIKEYKVVNSVGTHVGRISDIYMDLSTWTITGFEVSPGALKKDLLVGIEDVVKLDEGDKIMILKDDFRSEDRPERPQRERYPFEKLRKLTVLDHEGEKVGKVYDLEIPFEKLKTFKVWKVLIRTGISERRLRLNPSEIIEVMDGIKLAKAESEYQNSE